MKTKMKYPLYILGGVAVVGLTIAFSNNSTNFKGSLRDLPITGTQQQTHYAAPVVQQSDVVPKVSNTTSGSSVSKSGNLPIAHSHIGIKGETLKGDIVSAGTYELLRFDVAANSKNAVVFAKAPSNTYQPSDSLVSVVLKGNAVAGDIMGCSLNNVTDGQKLDTIDLSTGKGLNLAANGYVFLDFNFYDNDLEIAPGESKKLSVMCDLALTAGESVSATLPGMLVPGNDVVDSADADNNDDDAIEPAPLVYQVNNTLVADPVGAVEGLPVMGPEFVGAQG